MVGEGASVEMAGTGPILSKVRDSTLEAALGVPSW